MEELLERGDRKEIRALFALDRHTTEDEAVFLFRIWCRHFFPGYFMDPMETRVYPDAPFHDDIDRRNWRVYAGLKPRFINIVFRGGAKTTRTKLFLSFVIANDEERRRRYIKVLTHDIKNARQIVTDVFNTFVDRQIYYYYPEIFEKTEEKRSETMSEFDTATGIKVLAGTVGTAQRGQLQEKARPDLIWFDDFETRKTLRSAIVLQDIWNNMEEARTGLSKDGGAIYTCNYLSERGNVHRLVERYPDDVLIVPIVRDGAPTWEIYTEGDIKRIKAEADDFAGEYLCSPALGHDVFIDRAALERQPQREPIKLYADFKVFYPFDASHRYGSGHDVAGGVGLDSSTSVFIDFTQIPNRVVGTFKSNTVAPDVFAHEIERQARIFGHPIVAPENKSFGEGTIAVLKTIYDNIFFTKEDETLASRPPRSRHYGWNTNSATKPEMLFALKKAIEDGHLELSDPDLIVEAEKYTRDDLMDTEPDPRLTTRHFDLLIACAIAWAMRNHAQVDDQSTYEQAPYEPVSEFENSVTPHHQDNIHPLS